MPSCQQLLLVCVLFLAPWFEIYVLVTLVAERLGLVVMSFGRTKVYVHVDVDRRVGFPANLTVYGRVNVSLRVGVSRQSWILVCLIKRP
ncbi:hypothetical protein F511_07053 [Dorcoceras hygrometricum]|uniref:Uncharacterized protein n=1 Tax=Dorcoceras hygrometricum TaxID=472368 RepID=A0A2Z7D0S7_9LAMI|nr:hypothetical protein F511_07053 [Dorcoceras hygrometricum]